MQELELLDRTQVSPPMLHALYCKYCVVTTLDPFSKWKSSQLYCYVGDLVEINTNLVLFCFFRPSQDRPSQERCLILKFLHTRLLTQSEQFANELTRHLDICAPNCRILRQKVQAELDTFTKQSFA